MTFIQMRNLLIYEVYKYLGCPVRVSGQIDDTPQFPYCYYSVLTPRVSDHYFGLNEVEEVNDGFITKRSEEVTATLSFSFCGKNRQTETGFILGEDEALELAEKAHGFFLLYAHNLRSDEGEIVVREVEGVKNRSSFQVEDTVHRYGFDVRIAYVRTDEKPTTTIKFSNASGALLT